MEQETETASQEKCLFSGFWWSLRKSREWLPCIFTKAFKICPSFWLSCVLNSLQKWSQPVFQDLFITTHVDICVYRYLHVAQLLLICPTKNNKRCHICVCERNILKLLVCETAFFFQNVCWDFFFLIIDLLVFCQEYNESGSSSCLSHNRPKERFANCG